MNRSALMLVAFACALAMTRHSIAAGQVPFVAIVTVRAGAPYDPGPLARKVWDIIETVEKNDIEPPARSKLLLAGMRSLLTKTHNPSPGDLEARVATLKNATQLGGLLREAWPKSSVDPKLSTEILEHTFLDGVLESIPGKPWLMPPDSVRVSEQTQANRYVGIGLQLGINSKEKFPQIIIPTRHGPLRRAGAKAGDLIVEVDGKSTREVPLTTVVKWLRGEEGTAVAVTIRKPGETATRTLRLTRSVVPFDTVVGYRHAGEGWSYRIDPSTPIGYVRLESITSSTLHELRQIEPRLQSEGVRAVVFDLRSRASHADDLHSAALVADGLLDGGVLWRVRDSHQPVREVRAGRECLFRKWPMAVLIDADTRSATHSALAAALQDNGRAVLVGQPAGADGFVSGLVSLPDSQGAIAVRTGRLERAARERGWPVQPDHKVAMSKKEREELMAWLIQKGHADLPPGVTDRPPEDAQLARALALLRAALQTTKAGSVEVR